MTQKEAIIEAKKRGPKWRFVAMDDNSVWHAYQVKPKYDYEDGVWYTDEDLDSIRIGHTQSSGEYSLAVVPPQ